MNFAERACRMAAVAALASAWLWHLARAVTAAVTTDEAFTALDFAGKPWLEMLAYYDANNHVLHTVLVKLSLDTFGWNVVALRLPALLAAVLYLWMIWRMGRRWFDSTPALAAFCAILAWAPPVAEYFSLARGYALALAFFAWALDQADFPGVSRWSRVSLAMGLSVASNLVFVVPSLALAAVLLIRERAWSDFRRLAAPGAVVALIVNALPLSRSVGGHFYYGSRTWIDSLLSILEWPGFTAVSVASAILIPLAALAALRRADSRFLALTAFASAAIVAVLAAAGVPWPRSRTGVYLAFLLLLAALRWALSWKPAAWPALLLLPLSWAALPLSYHPEWSADASSRIIVERIAKEAPPLKSIIIAADSPLNYAIAFHSHEILGSRAQVVRSDQSTASPDFAVSSTPLPAGRVLFRDAGTSVALFVPHSTGQKSSPPVNHSTGTP